MIQAFRSNLAAAAAQAIQDHTGYVVPERDIEAYINNRGYPATLAKAVDFLSIPVGDLDDHDHNDMQIKAAQHFMMQGR